MLRAAVREAPAGAEQSIDRQLLASILLCPLAAGINTIVGFTVAHWVCDVNHKTTEWIVSAFDFSLCVAAALLAYASLRRLPEADETQPELGRRRFMAKMGLALSGFAAIVVLAGTLVMLTLGACD